MSLNKGTLQAAIKDAFKKMKSTNGDEEQTLDTLSGKLAEAIDTYVKTATIVYVTGLVAPPNGGVVSGTFNGNLQ
ncbi:hypothetical protein [Chitinophaga sp.]|uniref:hypothetical protein n=1 Tax=Chitinophaga sp. TaxID=1869181 RepID=UPI0031D6F3A3